MYVSAVTPVLSHMEAKAWRGAHISKVFSNVVVKAALGTFLLGMWAMFPWSCMSILCPSCWWWGEVLRYHSTSPHQHQCRRISTQLHGNVGWEHYFNSHSSFDQPKETASVRSVQNCSCSWATGFAAAPNISAIVKPDFYDSKQIQIWKILYVGKDFDDSFMLRSRIIGMIRSK